MKRKRITIFLVLVTCFAVLTACTSKEVSKSVKTEQPKDAVTFKDTGLEKIIRTEIKNANEPITKNEVATIEELTINSDKIKDLTGLKYLNQLKKLTIMNTPIQSLAELESLQNLTELNLNHIGFTAKRPNGILDYSSLSQLPNLIVLSIGSNKLEDLSFLGALQNLKNLTIQDAKLSQKNFENIFSLEHLKSLEMLNFSGNELKDLSPILELKELKNLNVSHNPIEDIHLINNFPKLTALSVGGDQQAVDVEWIRTFREVFPSLKEIYLARNSGNQEIDKEIQTLIREMKEKNIVFNMPALK